MNCLYLFFQQIKLNHDWNIFPKCMIILGKMGLYFIDKKRLLNRMCKLYISQVIHVSI